MNTLSEAAEKIAVEFEEVLIADGKAPKTLESYVGDTRAFLQWLESKGNISTENLKRFHVTSYRNYLVQEVYEVNTINKKINSLQSFNQFLMDKKYLTEQIVDLKKDKVKVATGSEREVEVSTDAEIEKLLLYIQSEEVLSKDRLIILLLLYTGVRVSELVNIKLKDVDMLSMNLTVAWGKGEIIEAIKEYLEGERRDNKFAADSEYLVLTNRSAKMDRDAVNRLLNRMESKLSIRMHLHKFRHTILYQTVEERSGTNYCRKASWSCVHSDDSKLLHQHITERQKGCSGTVVSSTGTVVAAEISVAADGIVKTVGKRGQKNALLAR